MQLDQTMRPISKGTMKMRNEIRVIPGPCDETHSDEKDSAP